MQLGSKSNMQLLLAIGIVIVRFTSAKHHGSPEDYFDELKAIFDKGGASAVKMFVDRQLHEWKDVPINIAITGTSGSGKSTFINTFLELTADAKGAAAVGVKETTANVKDYPQPKNPNLVLWDLPGVGTPNFNRENYCDKVKIDRFDFFIVMTSDRFRDDDLWLATQLDARSKQFYFVRNKVGQDITNNKYAHPTSHSDEAVLNEIRRNCEDNLQKINLQRPPRIYLTELHGQEKYEYGKLIDKMVNDTSENKEEAIILSMTHQTKTLIFKKQEVLTERIHKMALLSGISGALPVPLLDAAVDMGILVEEVTFYKDQFGLSEKALKPYADQLKITIEQFSSQLDLKSRLIGLTAKGVASYLTKRGMKKASTFTSAKILKYVLPLFGSVLSAGTSYTMTSSALHDLLDVIVEDALKINEHKIN